MIPDAELSRLKAEVSSLVKRLGLLEAPDFGNGDG